MATPNQLNLEVSLSPSNSKMLVISDSQGGQSTLSADRFVEMNQKGMKLEDIYSELRKADNTLDRMGLDAGRREIYEQLYGTHASASNLRDGNYLVSCIGANGMMLDSFKIPQADYVSLRAGGLNNGQIYGAIMDGKVQATRQVRDPEFDVAVEELEPFREHEVKLDARISDASIKGNTLTMTVDGKQENIKLTPRELAGYAQGVLPLSNLANEHLKLMDIMATASQNFEKNMGVGDDLLSMHR